MPISHDEAAMAIMSYAVDRNRHFPGCYVLSGFVPSIEILRIIRTVRPNKDIQGKELSTFLAAHLQANDALPLLVDGLLEYIATDPLHGDQEMAIRIRDQILEDRATKVTYRKPMHYVSVHEDGLAIAIAIDDRFWTDEW